MSREDEMGRIEQEQRSFDEQLEAMLAEHEGEFVLFRGEPVAYFSKYEDAYAAGLERFGVDQVFLISEVRKRPPQTTSLAWEAGVMFLR